MLNTMTCRVDVQNAEHEGRYIVARACQNELWFWGAWDDKERAEEVAKELGDNAIVLFNDNY